MHYVEEAAEKVHHDVKQRLGDNRPHLHEPGAVEALTVNEDNVSVEEDKEWTEHPVQKMTKKMCTRSHILGDFKSAKSLTEEHLGNLSKTF